MNFKKQKHPGKNEYYSLVNKLKKEEKITEGFEIMLNNLTLEEIIGLKLELASKPFGGKSYGLPIWSSMREIVQDAVLKYALSACKTKREAARFLGLRRQNFNNLIKKYNTESFFEKND
jgi:DNA-binding NtrC family response regulator